MVYCGKPSRSCRQCRTRDIKCDKQREACGQCKRANLRCPGYPDASSVIFRDETMSVLRKAGGFSGSLMWSMPSPAPCIEDRAKSLFISRYVFCKTGRFPFMEHFWHSQPRHPHLAMSLRAVSLACLSIQLSCDDIQRLARYRYTSALRLTSIALDSPQSATHNATILTVLLLYLYEKLTGHVVHDSTGEWKHLNGALTLLRVSNKSQFNDTIRLGLFRQLSMCIFLRCLRNGDDIPRALIALRQSTRAVDRDGHLEHLMAGFVELKSRIRKGEVEESNVYGAVKELDDVLVQKCSSVLRWKFADAITGEISDTELFIHLLEVDNTEP